jgi:hypothetical protein
LRIDSGFSVAGWLASGASPETRKKSCDEHHAERDGAAMLNKARWSSGLLLATQNEITRPSRATVSVPAAGQYRRTAVKTKASEIEIDTFARGSSTDAEPLMRVRTARRSHCRPCEPRGTR